ncbi:chlorophyllase-1, chloroplastic-like [Tripterygium wilfordii]|nr:chlorophyllase-1, chloroplastic-like [Tripterygium wilfordii]
MASLLDSMPPPPPPPRDTLIKQLPIFVDGPYQTTNFKVETSTPKPLFIVTPVEPGEYPLLQFHHGTLLQNIFYTQLLTHIASHGYIVVAPQLYTYWEFLVTNVDEEVRLGGEVTDWLLRSSLRPLLPDNVREDLTKIALAGHSRGGKVAFKLALDRAKTSSNPFKALIGIAPVAGQFPNKELPPEILDDQSFNLPISVTVIGTGVDSTLPLPLPLPLHLPLHLPLPSCDPEGVNHDDFYKRCEAPCGHFVARNYGHLDMLDVEFFIKGGEGPKDPFKRCVGGLVVASLKAGFENDFGFLKIIAQDPSVAPHPVNLDPCEYKIVMHKMV